MRPMRRKDRQKDTAFCLELIDRCTHGVVAMNSGEPAPYCLPLSLVRVGNDLYFHGATEGRKTDLLRAYPHVCVTFVGRDDPTYQEPVNNFTTLFSSVIVTGTASEVTSDEEKIAALRALCLKTLPAHMVGDNFERAVAASLPRTAVWKIAMEEITGKSR